jgi:hypothetical protein
MRHSASGRLLVLAIGITSISMPSYAERPEAPPAFAKVPASNVAFKPDTKANRIYLIDMASKSFKMVEKIDLPRRVYLKKTRMDGVYQQFLTGKNGKLSVPERVLLSGTVVRGDRLGGPKERFYFLTPEGTWRRTEGPEVFYVQDDTDDRQESIITPGEDDSTSPHIAQSKGPTHAPN